jgi:ribosome-interacting GTPase 1
MNKYIPKVGEVFQVYNDTLDGWHSRSKAVLITDKQVVYLDDHGLTAAICLTRTFRPIQTKTDVELDELIEVIYNNTSLIRQYSKNVAIKIQQAGFTIPKKIKRKDIGNTIALNLDSSYEIRRRITKAICNLLGDLVEQDEGGAS